MQVRIDFYQYRERGGVNVKVEIEVASPQEITKLLEHFCGPVRPKPEHVVEFRSE